VVVQTKPEYALAAVPVGAKTVALTLDDGPHPTWTPKVLAILKQHRITATFFMIGLHAAAHPGLVRTVLEAGHQVGTHTWSHANLKQLAAAEVRTEIEHGLDAVTTASWGLRPNLFRAPYGNWSPAVFAHCAALGQRSICWDVDPRDWETPGTAAITARVMAQVGPRSIVLCHDGGGERGQTVAALRTYVPQLLAAGYQFVGV
jgi:peptidoglycan/xylan/chitin deacetylase (PgdA/CDA1 family)